jgi:hypothetical protein
MRWDVPDLKENLEPKGRKKGMRLPSPTPDQEDEIRVRQEICMQHSIRDRFLLEN